MAPVCPTTRGHGVPGGLHSEPGTTQSCRLRVLFAKNRIYRGVSAAAESEPQTEARVFHCAHSRAQSTLRALVSYGAFHTQVSQANKTKRGLYVYQA